MDAQRSESERTGLLLSHAMRGHCPDLLAVTIDDDQDLLQRISLSTTDHPNTHSALSSVFLELLNVEDLLTERRLFETVQVARTATAQYEAIRFSTCPDPRTERDGHKGQSPFRHRAAARP